MLARDSFWLVRPLVTCALLVLAIEGCQRGPAPPEERVRAAPAEMAPPPAAGAPVMPSPNAAPPAREGAVPVAAPPLAGITWEPPPGFSSVAPGNAMRAAEYVSGDGAARLTVFHFPGMRETVDANIERWKQQFDETARQHARVETREVAGLAVTILDIEGGTAGMHGTDSDGASVERSQERMVGVAVVAPGGVVFFKLVGPGATVGAARGDVDAMIESLRPFSTPAGAGG